MANRNRVLRNLYEATTGREIYQFIKGCKTYTATTYGRRLEPNTDPLKNRTGGKGMRKAMMRMSIGKHKTGYNL